jgi:hypothetical protein
MGGAVVCVCWGGGGLGCTQVIRTRDEKRERRRTNGHARLGSESIKRACVCTFSVASSARLPIWETGDVTYLEAVDEEHLHVLVLGVHDAEGVALGNFASVESHRCRTACVVGRARASVGSTQFCWGKEGGGKIG